MTRLYTRISKVLSTALVAAVCGVLLTGGAITVFASKADLVTVASVKQKNDPMLVLTRGMAEIVNVDGPVSDIMVANPAIVDVSSLQANKLYIVGVNYGTTNVIAVDAEGNVVSRLNVHVKIDDVAIQNTVRKIFPNEEINITSTGEQVLLTGRVSTADVAARIADVVGSYMGGERGSAQEPNRSIVNMLTVEGEQQVMLKVKVVEASRDVLRELGVDTDVPGFNKASVNGTLNTVGAALGLTANPLGIGQVFYDTGTALGRVSLAIQALEEDGLVNTLAEPNLTAISGEQAGFLAGGEVPVPTGRDQNNNIVVTYRPFGVALNFRPVVMSGDRISLQLQTEVSSISNQGDVNIGVTVPSFAVRRASTTVEMGSGGSLMIAGLLQSDITKGMTSIPGINDIPILGKLASSDSFNRQETELVVIVTAYLVKPYADEKQAEEAPAQASSPLATAFAQNIRRTYSKRSLDENLFGGNVRYGYLLD